MRELWNEGWEFNLNDSPESRDNEEWIKVTLPYDWQIYDTDDLYRDGYGRYKKVFNIDLKSIRENKNHVFVVFDGVYMDSSYILNGVTIGEWKYGYSRYVLELTDHLKDGVNELIVGVNFKSPNSRWYSGAGIYRDVWFETVPDPYIPENGVYIHAEETDGGYHLYVDTEVLGDSSRVILNTVLKDAGGNEVEIKPVEPNIIKVPYTEPASKAYRSDVYFVEDPILWSVDEPYLYRLCVELKTQNGDTQEVSSSVGFKNVYCDPDKGFFLNGVHMKLNGVCEHHDLGVMGAEFNKSAMRRKIEILKTMGVNAIRGTHNMMAEGLLELCDEMGVLYISEAFDMWNHPKTEFDYARFFDDWHEKDVASWVRRDRNHTCVLMWSIGNEIADIHNYEKEGQAMTRHLMELVAGHDYRENAYITQGSNYMPWENAQKCADILKVAGYNYGESCYIEHHKEHPDWIIYGSETSSITQSRGVYHLPLSANSLGEEDDQCSALGNSTTSWSAKSYELCAAIDRDTEFSQGQFLWSGFDYIGEPTPYQTRSCYFGQIDTAGFPKDSYYFWKSNWTDPAKDPFVHVFPYWDFNEGQIVDVRVVSNLPEVELFVNGISHGRQSLDHAPGSGYHLIADWPVPYEKGEIRAVAYESPGSDKAGAECIRYSFGNTDKLIVKRYGFTSTQTPQDIAFYEISAVDKDGHPVENACDRVEVAVKGNGVLIGLDNGDSSDPDGYRVHTRRLFNGKLLAAVRITGKDDIELIIRIAESNEDIRRIDLKCEDSRQLSPDHRRITVYAKAQPESASGREISYKIVDDLGIKSHLASFDIVKNNDGSESININAKGDGRFRLRATAGSEGQKVRVISDMDFEITGCGQAYRNPYEFVWGSTYSSGIGEVGSGNEKGFATARGDRTVVIFEDIDFGSFGAESITIPIFSLDSDDVPLKVWAGVPGSGNEVLLVDTVYSKPRQWAVFIEDTWPLKHRVKGITSISFEFTNKVHVRGFIFKEADKARARLLAPDADAIYGDDFKRTETVVEHIGNNVSLMFNNMDFGNEGINHITIWGQTPNESNPVHVRFFREDETIKEVCEFENSDHICERTFELSHITGKWDVSFVFMPGSNFDFEAFRFQ
ncbi:MAG: DUF4982 domain-containing protein [Lachnospiraceae bacterium]|nr:DUF4982 domain-containing protein [Lachnospiraceae bacterium]